MRRVFQAKPDPVPVERPQEAPAEPVDTRPATPDERRPGARRDPDGKGRTSDKPPAGWGGEIDR